MPNTHPPLKLSRDEEVFLRHWVYDEAHFLTGIGLAKRLQVERCAKPADLATLIAAALPDSTEQEEAATSRPAATPAWPWDDEGFRARLAEAREVLDARSRLRNRS